MIYGHPYNYCKHGFVGSKSLNISNEDGKFPCSLLALELEKGLLNNHSWKFYESSAYHIDEKEALEFDKLFQKKEKEFRPSQEEFKIMSSAYII